MNLNFFAILLIVLGTVASFKCGHDKIANKTLISIEPIKPSTRSVSESSSESSYRKIDIYVDYSFLTTNANADSSTISNIKKGISEVVEMFQELLEVKPQGTFRITTPLTNCHKSFGVSKALSDGIDSDLIIFPAILKEDDLGKNVIASAGSCYNIKDTGRPIVGGLFLGETHRFSEKNYMVNFKTVLLHEISHILAFSPKLFELFPNQPYSKKKIVNGEERTILITEKVVEHARKHFGCSSLEGVELENQGGKGSEGSHWESRIMLSDYMISTDYEDKVLSDISLAVFEDSGWYKVNYYTGGLFRFGKGEGCSFLEDKCLDTKNGPSTDFPDEFCVITKEEKCYPSRTGKGICSIQTYSTAIPDNFQYFSDPTKGGYMAADYCPVPIKYTRTSSGVNGILSNHCKYGSSSQFVTGAMEYVGDDSMCVEGVSGSRQLALCYKVKCNPDSLSIFVGDEEVKCQKGGIKVSLANFNSFKLICPNYQKICTSTVYCNDIESCIKNKVVSLTSSNWNKVNFIMVFLLFVLCF